MPASESAHPAGQRLDRGVWIVASVLILGVVISLLDTTIANVALAALARELHAPVATIQWVSTGYLVSLALAIPLAGWLVERFGTKRVWMLAVAGFGAGLGTLRLSHEPQNPLPVVCLAGEVPPLDLREIRGAARGRQGTGAGQIPRSERRRTNIHKLFTVGRGRVGNLGELEPIHPGE